jgi:hypothetical protein
VTNSAVSADVDGAVREFLCAVLDNMTFRTSNSLSQESDTLALPVLMISWHRHTSVVDRRSEILVWEMDRLINGPPVSNINEFLRVCQG